MKPGAARLLSAVLFTLVGTGWLASAQAGASMSNEPEPVAAQADSAPAQDPWGFDEPKEETWREVLRPQAPDLMLLGAFLLLVVAGFLRKSVILTYVTLVAAVGYMGFVKSHLVSVVDIFGLISLDLPIARYNLAWYLLSCFVALSTLLWGRLYCGRACAFGALTQLMDAIVPARLRVEAPKEFERWTVSLKYVALALIVLYFLATTDLMVYRFVEPFWMFGRVGMPMMWVGLGTLLLGTLFVRNLYCRFLCPVGALLGLAANLTVFRISRWSECAGCRICERACKWKAIRGRRILPTECMRCDDCERLSRDTEKCPHWIGLRKRTAGDPPRARRSAEQSARAASSGRRRRAPGSLT